MRSAGVHSRPKDPSLGQSHCFNTTAKCFYAEEDAVEEGTFRNCTIEKSITFLESSEILSTEAEHGFGKQLYRKAI